MYLRIYWYTISPIMWNVKKIFYLCSNNLLVRKLLLCGFC